MWRPALRVYADLAYIEALFTISAREETIENYSLALMALRPHADAATLAAAERFIDFQRAESHFLAEFASGVIQQALNQPDDSPLNRAALTQLAAAGERQPRFCWINKAATPGPLSLRLRDVQASRGFSDWITCCAWRSADQVLSAGNDHQIRTWNTRTGRLLSSRNISDATPLRFSASGRLLLATVGGVLVVIDSVTGARTGYSIDFDVESESHAWSHDERQVAIGGRSEELIVWTPESGHVDAVPATHVKCCAWSPDGRFLVVGSDPPIVWDCHNRKQSGKLGDSRWVRTGFSQSWTTFSGHKGGANACAWSPDGKFIATGSGHGFGAYDDDFSVRIWNARTFKEVAKLTGHQDRVTSLSWSRDSRRLASTSGSVMHPARDNSIRVWDAASRRAVTVLIGHTNEVVSCAWHVDGRQLVSASKDGTLIVWDSKSSRSPDRVTGAYVSNDQKKAALPRSDHSIAIVDTVSGKESVRLTGHEDKITTCAWSPDDVLIATGSEDRTVRLWEVARKKNVAVLRGHSGDETYTAGGHRIVWGAIAEVAWAPDGELLASAGSDRQLMIWSRTTLREYRKLLGHVGPIVRCAWSVDGETIVSLGGQFEHIQDGAALLWDVPKGCELGHLSPGDADLEVLTSSRIVSTDRRGSITIQSDRWDGQSVDIAHIEVGTVWTLTADERVGDASWLPDGRHAVIATDNLIRFLDAIEQREIMRFPAMANIARVCVADGGRRVVAIDEAGAFYLLGVEGVELGTAVRPVAAGGISTRPQMVPLDERSGEAWLRMIRGMLINKTASPGELAELYRRLAALEPEGETFSSAIHDSYSESIAGLNAALWSIGAQVVDPDHDLMEKFLRTALLHTPDDKRLRKELARVRTAGQKSRKRRRGQLSADT